MVVSKIWGVITTHGSFVSLQLAMYRLGAGCCNSWLLFGVRNQAWAEAENHNWMWAMSVCAAPQPSLPILWAWSQFSSIRPHFLVAYIYRNDMLCSGQMCIARLQLNWLRYCMAYETSGWVALQHTLWILQQWGMGIFHLCFLLFTGGLRSWQDNMWSSGVATRCASLRCRSLCYAFNIFGPDTMIWCIHCGTEWQQCQ